MGQDKLTVLHYHLCRPRPLAPVGPEFTHEEMRMLTTACVTIPFHTRFARPFRNLLAEMLKRVWPALAAKVANLSGYQFERLFERLCQRG
jgi:hypothetical protein